VYVLLESVESALTGAGFKVVRGSSPDGGIRLTVRSAQSQTLGHIDVASSGEVRPNIFKQVSAVNAAMPKVEITST
jgi:DNA-binding FrmR family transcriptional regulator